MRTLLLIVLAFSTNGCVSVKPIPMTGPNGKPAYTMKCNGMGRTLEACYQKAGEVCPQGWNVIDRASSTLGMPNGSMIPQHNLTIECKG